MNGEEQAAAASKPDQRASRSRSRAKKPAPQVENPEQQSKSSIYFRTEYQVAVECQKDSPKRSKITDKECWNDFSAQRRKDAAQA